LNAQGRFLHDLFIHRVVGSQPTVFVDVDANTLPDIIRVLKRYRLRQKIEIDDVSQYWTVWARFGADDKSTQANLCWPPDPRGLSDLGARGIFPASDDQESIISNSNSHNIVHWDAYRRWRIALGVAEGDAEIPSGEAVALEYNIDGLNGISFSKGCYVGQELMARTHFKGIVRKRVMPVSLDLTGVVAVGDSVLNVSSGKSIGTIRAMDKDIGLAHLRLKEALEAASSGNCSLRTEGGVEVRPRRPSWWPATWGLET
jgi:folate-binding protein YgfZ